MRQKGIWELCGGLDSSVLLPPLGEEGVARMRAALCAYLVLLVPVVAAFLWILSEMAEVVRTSDWRMLRDFRYSAVSSTFLAFYSSG